MYAFPYNSQAGALWQDQCISLTCRVLTLNHASQCHEYKLKSSSHRALEKLSWRWHRNGKGLALDPSSVPNQQITFLFQSVKLVIAKEKPSVLFNVGETAHFSSLASLPATAETFWLKAFKSNSARGKDSAGKTADWNKKNWSEDRNWKQSLTIQIVLC